MTLQKTDRSRLKRRPARGRYDEETVYGLLDAGLVAHVGYVDGGQPFVTPTAYWREGDSLFWHGARQGRFVNAVIQRPVCVTVTQFDGLVFARSGLHHSAMHRTVMAFGHCTLITDPAEKRAGFDAFLNKVLPGRAEAVRPATDQEIGAASLVRFTIEEASAKARTEGVLDAEPDYAFPVWAGVMRIATVIERIEDDDRLVPGTNRPAPFAGGLVGQPLSGYLSGEKQI